VRRPFAADFSRRFRDQNLAVRLTGLHLCRFAGQIPQDGGYETFIDARLPLASLVDQRRRKPLLHPCAVNPNCPISKRLGPISKVNPQVPCNRYCNPSKKFRHLKTKAKTTPALVKVAQNLYRSASGRYYTFLKRAGKQFHRALKTGNRRVAERKLADLKASIDELTISENANASFGQIARHWLDVNKHALSESTTKRKALYIQAMGPFFSGVTIRNLKPIQCEKWVLERGVKLSASSFNHELECMRAIFDYARQRGLILNNPTSGIARKKSDRPPISVPTREQFVALVEAIRLSDGRPDSQAKAQHGADLVELLAYSGCRLREAQALRWKHVNLDRNRLTVAGTKTESSSRVIPMSTALHGLLTRLRQENRAITPNDRIVKHASARKCLETACRKLTLPPFTHHSMRHFFATACIEFGVDIPTVSRWLGHRDGGALAMRVYNHWRQSHSDAMIALVRFEQTPRAPLVSVQAA